MSKSRARRRLPSGLERTFGGGRVGRAQVSPVALGMLTEFRKLLSRPQIGGARCAPSGPGMKRILVRVKMALEFGLPHVI